MAVLSVALPRGPTTSHCQRYKRRSEGRYQGESLRLPSEGLAVVVRELPKAVPGVIDTRKKVSWHQSIALKEETPGELGPASCLRELSEYLCFVDEITNVQTGNVMCPRTQPLNVTVSMKRVEGEAGDKRERENLGLEEVHCPKRPRELFKRKIWGPRLRAFSRGMSGRTAPGQAVSHLKTSGPQPAT